MPTGRPTLSSRSPLGRRLWWLIAGRAATVIVLVIIGATWKWKSQGATLNSSLGLVSPLILTVAGLTMVYCIARLVSKNYIGQSRIQVVFDILLVTWLVWITGVSSSPYAALYILIISVASLFVGPRGAMITSIGCVAAFNGCALIALGLSEAGFSSETAANTIQFIGLSDVS